jgi:MoaA/NifB/PqqE/SkfB family radical SAM enzyme
MLGGEPFMHPRFIELCQGLTENHIISMNTNLSSPKVYEFADKIDPKKVRYFICSTHIPELERLNLKKDFFKKYDYMNKKGFRMEASLVVWPPLLKRLKNICDEFQENGVTLMPTVFRGFYEGKRYPESYTKKELILIRESNKQKESKLLAEIQSAHGALTFEGSMCKAGVNHIVVSENGDVSRCASSHTIMGNIYKNNVKFLEKPEECNFRICACAYEGRLLSSEKPRLLKRNFQEKIENLRSRINLLNAKKQ